MSGEIPPEPTIVFSGDVTEAGLVRSLLESSGIAAYEVDANLATWEPWVTAPAGVGAVKVVVAAGDEERARAVIEAYRNRAAGGSD